MYKTTQNLKNDIVKAIYDYIQINYKDIYFFMGKSSRWGPSDILEEVNTELDQTNAILNDIILMYRLNPNNISLGFDRINWASGQVFDEYLPNSTGKNSHVITSNYSIYKCIDNNSNSESTVEPTHKTLTIPLESDGYRWKYLYTLSPREISMFLTDAKIPIQYYNINNSQQIITENNAIPGTIDAYKITSVGSGYTYINLEILGDGTGATAEIKFNRDTGQYSKPIVTNAGKNYTWAEVVVVGDGTGLEITPIVSPKNGHGSNLLKELNANSVIISNYTATKTQDIDNTPSAFEYRRIGLLSNIKDNTSEFNPLSLPTCYKLIVKNSRKFIPGDIVEINNIKGVVVSKTDTFNTQALYINELEKNINVADFTNVTISVPNTLTSTEILSCVYKPNINSSFNILHMENIEKRVRYEYTLDLVKTIIDL